jgi:hypothetical protein
VDLEVQVRAVTGACAAEVAEDLAGGDFLTG